MDGDGLGKIVGAEDIAAGPGGEEEKVGAPVEVVVDGIDNGHFLGRNRAVKAAAFDAGNFVAGLLGE